jgi:arylsulfatase A-like enzyme
MGYADIGSHGCKDIPTPHIDRIGKAGVRFTDGYANGSFCTPTRAALMSCRYQHRFAMEDPRRPAPCPGAHPPKKTANRRIQNRHGRQMASRLHSRVHPDGPRV